MSDVSVISDVIDCPQCGLPAQKDDYYVIGDERVVCNYCGYSHIVEAGEKEISMGYGSIHYSYPNENKNGSNKQIIRLKAPLSTKAREHTIAKINNECDSNHSAMYIWNEDRLECLHGIIPRTLEQQYQDSINEMLYYRSLMYQSGNIVNITDFDDF